MQVNRDEDNYIILVKIFDATDQEIFYPDLEEILQEEFRTIDRAVRNVAKSAPRSLLAKLQVLQSSPEEDQIIFDSLPTLSPKAQKFVLNLLAYHSKNLNILQQLIDDSNSITQYYLLLNPYLTPELKAKVKYQTE